MIRYTLDGSDPAATSPAYTEAVTVNAGQTLKSRAFKPGRAASAVATASFTATPCAPPLITTTESVYRTKVGQSFSITMRVTSAKPVTWHLSGKIEDKAAPPVGGCVIAVVASGAEPGSDRREVQEIKNSVGMKLVYISPGKFLMGSPENEPGREAQEVQHEVELTKGFCLGMHEVTVGQFKQFVADTKFQTDGERDGKGAYGANEVGKIEEMHARFTWKSPGFEQTDEHPVVDVSWQDAKAFCNWLSERENKTYRLPTEAEREYACRAGTQTAYVHGEDPEGLATVGNGADATARAKFPGWSIGIQGKDGHLFTAPVGQFKANPFGLYDMHGNVWEWCEDWYVPNSYPKKKQIDPTGPATGKAKVQRGGGWSSDSKRLRSAARVGRDQSAYRGCYLGFRVVLEKSPAEILKESGATQKIPAGGRVAYMLLVNGAVTDAVVKAANIAGHKSVDAPYIGTWHDIKGMDRIQLGRLDRLERGEIDTLLIGTLHCYPSPRRSWSKWG